MNNHKIATTIVLYHYQGHATKFDRFRQLADEVGIDVTDDDIHYGIKNIFYNNSFTLKDAKDEIEKKLGALRYIVHNSIKIINKYGGYKYEEEVYQLTKWLPEIFKALKNEGYDIYNTSCSFKLLLGIVIAIIFTFILYSY